MASPCWEQVREAAFASNGLMASSPVGYLFASPLVPILSSITDYAAESFPAGAGIFTSAADLMGRINRDFAYDTKATEISTPLQDVFDKRRGVCQDFAHIMIAGAAWCRIAGGVCQRLSADHAASGQATASRCGCDARVGVGLVRRGDRMGRVRSHQRSGDRHGSCRSRGRPRLHRRLACGWCDRRLAQAEAHRGCGRDSAA